MNDLESTKPRVLSNWYILGPIRAMQNWIT